jgi:hypothetical protein
MAYSAVRFDQSAGRQVFASATDAAVVSTDASGISDVVAVTQNLTIAQQITTALNGV